MSRDALVPDYMLDFKCIGPECEDTCCSGWNVKVDKTTFKKYRNIKDIALNEKLRKVIKRNRTNNTDSNYAKIKFNEDNKCSLLTKEGWCGIHAELGESYLCNTCALYPRHLNEVDSRLEGSLTLSCPEAARMILLNPEGINFSIVENDFNGEITYKKDSKNHPLFWELRMFTIRVLQNRIQPIETRLIILGLFFNKINYIPENELIEKINLYMELYEGFLSNPEKLETLLKQSTNYNFQVSLAKELIHYRILSGITSQRYVDCLTLLNQGLDLDNEKIEVIISNYKDAYTYYLDYMGENTHILENYLVNYVFKNLFPLDKSTLFESYVMMVVNYSLIKLHLVGISGAKKELKTKDVIKLMQAYSKMVEHDTIYLKTVNDFLKERGFSNMAHMTVLIKG